MPVIVPGVPDRRWVVGGACALVLLGVLVGYLARGGGHSDRADLAAARAKSAALAARLRGERARSDRALRKARAAADAASAYSRVVQREILGAQGGHSPTGFCSSHDFPTVDVKILAPAAGSAVKSPVIAHLVVDKPFGCNAEYYVKVDDALYAPVQHFERLAPVNSPRDPQVARRVPGNPTVPPPATCFGGVWDYIRFSLPPGDHVLSVTGGCAQGTEVPKATATPVRFTVTP